MYLFPGGAWENLNILPSIYLDNSCEQFAIFHIRKVHRRNFFFFFLLFIFERYQKPNQSFYSNNVNQTIIQISHILITMNIQHDLRIISFLLFLRLRFYIGFFFVMYRGGCWTIRFAQRMPAKRKRYEEMRKVLYEVFLRYFNMMFVCE